MPVLVYSLLRLLLLLVALVALYLAGVGGWLLVVLATVAAWAASYVLLTRPRDDAARWLADRGERRRSRGVTDADAEDEDREAGVDPGAGRDDDPEADARPGDQIARPRPSSTP